MSEVLYALEIWVFVALLAGWFLARAASNLRGPVPIIAADEATSALDPATPASVGAAVRVFDDGEHRLCGAADEARRGGPVVRTRR